MCSNIQVFVSPTGILYNILCISNICLFLYFSVVIVTLNLTYLTKITLKIYTYIDVYYYHYVVIIIILFVKCLFEFLKALYTFIMVISYIRWLLGTINIIKRSLMVCLCGLT